jgi:hypothetical protein
MQLELQKSVISAYDYKTHKELPTEDIRYNGGALVRLPAQESFRYLGVRAALAGRKWSIGPGTAEQTLHIFGSTRELIRLLAQHQIQLSFLVPSLRMVAQPASVIQRP